MGSLANTLLNHPASAPSLLTRQSVCEGVSSSSEEKQEPHGHEKTGAMVGVEEIATNGGKGTQAKGMETSRPAVQVVAGPAEQCAKETHTQRVPLTVESSNRTTIAQRKCVGFQLLN